MAAQSRGTSRTTVSKLPRKRSAYLKHHFKVSPHPSSIFQTEAVEMNLARTNIRESTSRDGHPFNAHKT